jgi:peptide deformylase
LQGSPPVRSCDTALPDVNERLSIMPLEQLMSIGSPRPITRWGAAVLHRPSRPVTHFDTLLWALLCDMFATNRAAEGAGLAAPQVGVDLAVFVYDCHDAFGRRRQGLLCNPQIALAAEPREDVGIEGCLSLPGSSLPLSRPDFAICRGQDQFGTPIKVAGTGTLARCLQHETDHVNGIVMEDRLSPSERRELRRQHEKAASEYPLFWPT